MDVLIVDYDEHAFIRLAHRSCQFDLDMYDALSRVEETIAEGRVSRSKHSDANTVYYRYFHDNLSFFVFCRANSEGFVVKTVIICEVRE